MRSAKRLMGTLEKRAFALRKAIIAAPARNLEELMAKMRMVQAETFEEEGALLPHAIADLERLVEHLTPLSEVWRGYAEAVAEVHALDGHPDAEKISDAENGRDSLEALLVATPPRSPADALVQLIYVAKEAVLKTLDDEHKVRADYVESLDVEDLIVINAVLALLVPGVLGRIAEALTPPAPAS